MRPSSTAMFSGMSFMPAYVCEGNREFVDPDTGAQRMRFRNDAE